MTRPAAAPTPPVPAFVHELDVHVRARYPLLYLVSWEEQRVDGVLEQLARQQSKELWSWSITKGLVKSGAPRAAPVHQEPVQALEAIERMQQPAIVVLKDFHPFFVDAAVVRRLRELAYHLKGTYKTVCLLSPTLTIPPELEKEITVIDVPLPTPRELFELLKNIVDVVRQGGRVKIDLPREATAQLVNAARGLTLSEAENAFAKAVVDDQRLSAEDARLILEEKKQVIRKSGLLEYYSTEEGLSDVGGLELLKSWLERRAAAFGEPARQFGLPEPKGLLLLGVQGCGKSLTAKAVAGAWKLPLLRLDMGRIFSGLIGSSEENVRRAIKVAESVAPVVLWVDEIEKGMSGMGGGGNNDSGVSTRVFATLLTWLQEKTSPVFVIATANKIEHLPPELMRKGRFDEIFFVDLPGARERASIFGIHLRKRKRDPAAFDLAALAARAEGFSGAEIEQAVVEGLYDAFAEKRELEQRTLERALGATRPLSQTMREDIERLRHWAAERTRPAGITDDAAATGLAFE